MPEDPRQTLRQATRSPDDRTTVAVEVDIRAGQVAVARGQHVAALCHSTTARVGLFQITGDPEHDRLTAALHRLDVAVRQHLRRWERP